MKHLLLAALTAAGLCAQSERAELTESEQFLVDRVDATECGRHLRRLTERPHMAGTAADYQTAVYVRDQLIRFGFKAELEEYHVLLSSPKRLALHVVAPVERELDLRESAHQVDKDSFDTDAVPTFNAYSASGDITAPVVYAHYGRAEDFDWLEGQGVEIAGSICLIRYGKVFRGLKVYEAQQRGALGVLLYSEPSDDGFPKGDVYPEGPWRPKDGVQRGSILFLSHLCGDPLTPGWPAHENVRRLDRDECSWLPKIPCLPIGYGNAEVILRHLRGRNVPQGWQGHCPVTYHTGPGPTHVRMQVDCEESIRPIWNVIGRLATDRTPERFVMIGNHRDSWVHGAIDPNSGSAVSLEAARVLGALVENGWEPGFEIRYGSWDGEEFGLIGSTEWCEDHADEIQQNCVAYLNCDGAVSGDRFTASATPDLVEALTDAAARTQAHDGRGRLLTRWAHGGSRPPVGNLGSGSDYTAFVCRLGVSCLDFGSRGGHGVYHSLYDNAFTMERHIDPNYSIHASMARFLAIATYRLAAGDSRLDASAWAPWLHAAARGVDLDDAGQQRLTDAIDRLEKAAASGAGTAECMALHRSFLDDAGIRGRTWFRNLTVAPALELGYGARTLPGLAEAIAAEDDDRRALELERLILAIDRATESLGHR